MSNQDHLPFRVQIKGKALEGVLSRNFLNRMGADVVDRAESLTREALAAAGVIWDDLDHVLLAGGTARMPFVKQSVDAWGGRRCATSLIGSDAAPGGASLFAQLQIHGPGPNLDFRLHEVASHYFGIRGTDRRTQQKKVSVVIPQNTPLPATARRTFRTSKDGQTSLVLEIVEGTGSGDTSGRPVGSCQIENLPPGMPAGTPIEIELHASENGMISVFVESLATGRRSSPSIQRAGAMTAEERLEWRDWLDTGSMCGQFA